MTVPITLNNLANLQNQTTAVNTINGNNGSISTAFSLALDTNGDKMNGNLDMNNNQILNLPSPATSNSPARLVDVTGTAPLINVPPVGTSGATVPLLNSNVTFSGNNIHSGTETFNFSTVSSGITSTVFFTTSGIVVPANSTHSAISVRQPSASRNTATIGSGSIFSGFYVDIESLSGSDATSNCYAAVLHVTNDGPGITKGVHAGAYATTGSIGAIVALNAQLVPVATTNSGSSCLQVSPTQNAGVADGIISGINIVSSDVNGVLNNVANGGIQYNYVIGCPLTTVPVKTAFMEWQVGSTSGATARFIQLIDNNGNEIQYIKKTGELVSSTALIAGTETNGISITQAAITRNTAAGTMTISAGASGLLALAAGSNTGLQVNSDGSVSFPNSTSFSANGAVATVLGSAGPTGSHTSPQNWLTIKDNAGIVRYIPCF